MSVANTIESVTTAPVVVRNPRMRDVLDAFEIDEARPHGASLEQHDFEGDGEALYLDVAGFFDLDDEIGPTDRSLSVQRIV